MWTYGSLSDKIGSRRSARQPPRAFPITGSGMPLIIIRDGSGLIGGIVMTGKQYEQYIDFFRKHPDLVPGIKMVNHILTLTGFIVYPAILVCLLRKRNRRFLAYLLIPATAFGLVSLFRKLYNRPRPYEDPGIHTLTKRDKKGNSFPSRHIFSYFLISVLLWSLSVPAGILMMATGVVLAAIRVILGVHYPSDVLAGMVLGLFSGFATLVAGPKPRSAKKE